MANDPDIIRAREEPPKIRESLKADPTGVTWLNTKMEKVDPNGPWKPMEQKGIEAAIIGVGKLYNLLTTSPSPPK